MPEGFPSKEAREVLEWILSFMYFDFKKASLEEKIVVFRNYYRLIEPFFDQTALYSSLAVTLASSEKEDVPSEKFREFEIDQKGFKGFFEKFFVPFLELEEDAQEKIIGHREMLGSFDPPNVNFKLGFNEKGLFDYWVMMENKVIGAFLKNLREVDPDLFNRCQECGKWFLAKRPREGGVRFCSEQCNWRYKIREKRKREKEQRKS